MTDSIAVVRLVESLPEDAIAAALISSGLTLGHLNDIYDIAEHLCRDAAIDGRLRWATRSEATRLAALAASVDDFGSDPLDAALRNKVLVDASGAPLDRVAARVEAADLERTPPPERDSQPDDAAIHRAISTVRAVYGLLVAISQRPVQVLAHGGFARADRSRLATFLGTPVDDLAALTTLAESASLVTRIRAASVGCTPRAREWMAQSDTERLWALIDGIHAALPAQLVAALTSTWRAGAGPQWWEGVEWELPFGGETREAFREPITTLARLLGLVDDAGTTSLGATAFDGSERPSARISEFETPTIDYVYPQADATIIAPGVLRPELDARLLSCAHCLQFGDASVYGLSGESISAALAAGQTAEQITSFLDGLSRGGLPQPLRYVIADTAGKFGEIQVSTTRNATVVSTANAPLATTLLYDRTLAALSLQRDENTQTRLTSSLAADVVTQAISDARYSVIRVDVDAEVPLRNERRAVAGPVGALLPNTSPDARLVAASATITERIRSRLGSSDPAALRGEHRGRILELSIKRRGTVRLTVTMPNQEEAYFTLEPTGLSGGRVRGRDTHAQTERTFPLSHVTDVQLVDDIEQ